MRLINTAKVNQFVRNALTGESNKTEDPFLSRLEDKINLIGQYIKQRHGVQAFNELADFIHTPRETMLYRKGVKVIEYDWRPDKEREMDSGK